LWDATIWAPFTKPNRLRSLPHVALSMQISSMPSAGSNACYQVSPFNSSTSRLSGRSLLHLLQHHQCQVGLLMLGDAWSLQVDNQTVTSDLHPHIIWHHGHCTAYKYMVEKNQYISSTEFALINFPALSTALKSASPLYQLWFSLATLPLDI